MILLISNLHLQEERPDITRAFLRFLEDKAAHAKALYILGDFFEVWIGDDGASPFQKNIAKALRAVSDGGTQIFLMHGNRDFLIGKRFCSEAGVTLLKDPTVVEMAGQHVLLMHGDSLCTRDLSYMKMRKLLRNPFSLFILRHLPLSQRQKLAQNLRAQSKMQTRMKAADIVDVTPSEVERTMTKHQVLRLIHGHTHRPATHTLTIEGKEAQRVVLGDWDRFGWMLRVDDNGFHQECFALAPN